MSTAEAKHGEAGAKAAAAKAAGSAPAGSSPSAAPSLDEVMSNHLAFARTVIDELRLPIAGGAAGEGAGMGDSTPEGELAPRRTHPQCLRRLGITAMKAKLTPAILKDVKNTPLPPELMQRVKEYTAMGVGSRNPFLWKWLFFGTQMMSMRFARRGIVEASEGKVTATPRDLEDAATMAKSLINFLNVTTDDIGDEDKDIALLRQIENDWFEVADATPADDDSGAGGDATGAAAGAGSTAPGAKRSRTEAATEADAGSGAGASSWASAPKKTGAPAPGTRESKSAFCHLLRDRTWALLRSLPRFNDVAIMLERDVRNMLDEKRYSAMCNDNPHAINRTEHSLFAPHTMHAMIFLSVDLMATTQDQVDKTEMGLLRAMYWHANVMANIANCCATWPREVPKRDWSSPLFPLAVEQGVFTVEELGSLSVEAIMARIESSSLEDELLHEWYARFDAIEDLAPRVRSLDAHAFNVQNMAFLLMHLACRGFI